MSPSPRLGARSATLREATRDRVRRPLRQDPEQPDFRGGKGAGRCPRGSRRPQEGERRVRSSRPYVGQLGIIPVVSRLAQWVITLQIGARTEARIYRKLR